MKVELNQINGNFAGYNLVAEDEQEREILKIIQQLHNLPSKKADRIEYDGVMTDEKSEITRAIFLQRKFAIVADYHPDKQTLYKAMMQKGTKV